LTIRALSVAKFLIVSSRSPHPYQTKSTCWFPSIAPRFPRSTNFTRNSSSLSWITCHKQAFSSILTRSENIALQSLFGLLLSPRQIRKRHRNTQFQLTVAYSTSRNPHTWQVDPPCPPATNDYSPDTAISWSIRSDRILVGVGKERSLWLI